MNEKVKKKMYTEILPKHSQGNLKGRINWDKVNNYNVKFEYDDLKGEIKILSASSKGKQMVVEYNNKSYEIRKESFRDCHIGCIINKHFKNHKFKVGDILQNNTDSKFKVIELCRDKNNKKSYKVQCVNCKSVLKISEYYFTRKDRNYHCRVCYDGYSYPEKFMFNILKQCNLEFDYQKSDFHWSKNIIHENDKLCGDKVYDFYIFSLNCIIETHGDLHYKNSKFKNKRNKTLDEIKMNDILKREIATKNNIKNYIEIDCRESNLKYIKESILKSKLAELVDLSKVDWEQCVKYATSNIGNLIKDTWKLGIYSISQISDMFKVSRQTVTKYLKIFGSIGECKYDPKVQREKGLSYGAKSNNKKVICLDNEYVFNSVKECAENSIKFFNVKLSSASVSISCRNGGKHKGLHFKYISDLTPEEYIKYDIENKLKELNKASS